MINSERFAKGTAARRGLLGGIFGIAGMTVYAIVMLVMTSSGNGNPGGAYRIFLTIFTCLIAGPLYGFGFAFANWHLVMKNTAQSFVEGGSVLGIGLILSSLTKDKKWGMFGWLYFILRVAWHIGMCWIPGIYYGVKAIRAESKEWEKTKRKPTPAQQQPVQQSQSTVQQQPVQQSQSPVQQPAQRRRSVPALTCTGGLFAGNSFPITPGEEIYLGSDPEVCQIVFPQDVAWPIHCVMVYDNTVNAWRIRDLSGGNTYRNGVYSMKDGQWQTLNSGTMLSIGQGKNSQRFQLS